MKVATATLLVLGAASQPALNGQPDEPLQITRSGSQASERGPADYFAGSVRIDSRFQRSDPARVGGAIVTFEPGARTAWHTHPLGQTLIVTSGSGWVQREGGAKEEIRAGDIVWTPPGVKHWHGATSTVAMTHIAITEALNGNVVKWMEQVSDEQYDGRSRMQGRPDQ
jgi:quercetin dioxygenase-like cupin family protein